MTNLEDYYATLKPNTLITYKPFLLFLTESYPKYSPQDFITNIEQVTKLIESHYPKLSQKEKCYSALSSFLKFNKLSTTSLGKNVFESLTKRKEVTRSKHQTITSTNVLIPKWNSIKEETFEDLRDKLALDFFVNYPPLRSDLFHVKIKNYKSEEHHILKDFSKIVIPKCIKTNIPTTIKINETTKELIKKYLKKVPGETDYFIYMNNETADRFKTPNIITRFLGRISKKHLDQEIKINDFRKGMVSKVEEDHRFEAPKEKMNHYIALSKQMGHTVATQQMDYNVSEEALEFKPSKKIIITGTPEYAQSGPYLIIKGNYTVKYE